jgi:N-formylglutamate deformylase
VIPVEVQRGNGPIVLGMPHVGTWLPPDIRAQLNARGATLSDTDWHVDQLYAGLLPSATVVRATFHRYVIDANRPPDGRSLYPGQHTTGLVPLTDFDGQPIWTSTPDAVAIETRRREFHTPYHATLSAELLRVRAEHGVALLVDCHSIRSVIPYLFEGTLPDINIGTADGASCGAEVAACVRDRLATAHGYSVVHNGRFKGGWTTRYYGRPSDGIHALQIELAQRTHLQAEAPPFAFDPARAAPLQALLHRLLADLESLAPSLVSTDD